MINSQMKDYTYSIYSEHENEYAEKTISATGGGTVKIAINLMNNQIVDNALYKTASYIGLTFSSAINDTCIIDYEGEKLKVLYVVPQGRMKQVFLSRM